MCKDMIRLRDDKKLSSKSTFILAFLIEWIRHTLKILHHRVNWVILII